MNIIKPWMQIFRQILCQTSNSMAGFKTRYWHLSYWLTRVVNSCKHIPNSRFISMHACRYLCSFSFSLNDRHCCQLIRNTSFSLMSFSVTSNGPLVGQLVGQLVDSSFGLWVSLLVGPSVGLLVSPLVGPLVGSMRPTFGLSAKPSFEILMFFLTREHTHTKTDTHTYTGQ